MNGIKFLNKNYGFTLLEVLIAFVITAISIATILNAFSMAHKQLMRGEEEKEVARVAEFILANIDSGMQLQKTGDLSGEVPGNGGMWRYVVNFTDVFIEGIKMEEHGERLKEMDLTIISPISNREYTFTTWVLQSDNARMNLPKTRDGKSISPNRLRRRDK